MYLLQVGANAGVVGMAKEHLGLALALNVPVFVVVTKVDMCPPNVLQDTLKMLQKILKSPGCRKIPVLVQSLDDVVVSATNFTSERWDLHTTILIQIQNTISLFSVSKLNYAKYQNSENKSKKKMVFSVNLHNVKTVQNFLSSS